MAALELRPGMRLFSVACATEVIIVKAPPSAAMVDCGGRPMVTAPCDDHAGPDAAGDEGTLLGKRYVDVNATIELLCTRPGSGSLSLNGTPLSVKAAKLLPSSD